MATNDQLGTLPLSVLTARPSPSAERSKRAEIERSLRLTPLQRVERALKLGREFRRLASRHGSAERHRTGR